MASPNKKTKAESALHPHAIKPVRAVLLMSSESAKQVCNVAGKEGILLQATIVESKPALLKAFTSHPDLLLSFGTSVIVPGKLLKDPSLIALNVHAASPRYPGRDPHHFAIYDNVKEYGATLHYMEKNVDSGPIVDVELFAVQKGTTPSKLLKLANQAGWRLIKRFFRNYAANGRPKVTSRFQWGKRKTTRKKFLNLCRINARMKTKEIHRRKRATEMPGFCNLYTDIAGLRFRIDEKRA